MFIFLFTLKKYGEAWEPVECIEKRWIFWKNEGWKKKFDAWKRGRPDFQSFFSAWEKKKQMKGAVEMESCGES